MHFYPHNIADFNNATRHLTRVERSVYRDAIEHYYDTESVLTKDFKSLSKRLLCFTEEEKEALKTVLSEFFTETDEGYFNERCNAEILKYRANTSAKAKAGIASAAKRKQKLTDVQHVLNECKTDVQLTNNQELITNNQETITNKKNTKKNNVVVFESQKQNDFEIFWQRYPKKVGKQAAITAWKKFNPRLDDVMFALSWQIESDQWTKQGGQFIPNPATYINQGRWQDQPIKQGVPF